MTTKEKFEMYKSKESFIAYIDRAFKAHPENSSIAKVEYEVFEKELNDDKYFQEFIVVTFNGGARSVRNANCNSNMANLVELGKLVKGGYYDEVEYYNSLTKNGFKKVVF